MFLDILDYENMGGKSTSKIFSIARTPYFYVTHGGLSLIYFMFRN